MRTVSSSHKIIGITDVARQEVDKLSLNFLLDDKSLASFELKAFTDHKLNVEFVFYRVKNNVENEQMLLTSIFFFFSLRCFQRVFSSGASEVVIDCKKATAPLTTS